MHNITAGAGFIQIFIHNDDHTPLEFVRDLIARDSGSSVETGDVGEALDEMFVRRWQAQRQVAGRCAGTG